MIKDNLVTKQWYSKDNVDLVISPNKTSIRSRYDLKDNLVLKDNNTVIRNLRRPDMVPYLDSSSTQHYIEAKENFRPDITAYNMYGDARYAWVILSANNMSDIFEYTTGKIITIPSVTSLYRTGGVMTR